jgi:hypothetical protein
MGRLSNPREALENIFDLDFHPTTSSYLVAPEDTKRLSRGPGSGVQEEKGQLSNPVLRRLSPVEVSELVRAYQEGTRINDLASRFIIHRTTVISHVRRAGVVLRSRRLRV